MKTITPHTDDTGYTYLCVDCQDGDGEYICPTCKEERRYDDLYDRDDR